MNKKLYSDNKKTAYTLAEVLITLGTIGIITAITMPILIKNYQMKSYAVKFKKHYSLLQNTINYLQIEENLNDCYVYYPHGSHEYIHKTDDCSVLRQSIIEKLKLTKIPNSFKDLYSSRDIVVANGGEVKNSSFYYENYDVPYAYMFKDGCILIFCYKTSVNGRGLAFMVLDTNGKKGPNKWGYDVFYLSLTRGNNGELKLGDNLASIKEKGGFYPNEMLLK